jgi:mitogen-activated protein kinase organizer 1
VILWNPFKGTLIKQYKHVQNYEVYDLAISADNSLFASVGGDKLVFIWDVKTGN